jgi:hypothetical protein
MGDDGRAIRNGSDPRLVPLSVPAASAVEPAIDDALDGLVTTVDDLARDLSFDDLDAPYGAASASRPDVRRMSFASGASMRGRAGGERAHANAYTVGVMAVLVLFELLVLWVVLHG